MNQLEVEFLERQKQIPLARCWPTTVQTGSANGFGLVTAEIIHDHNVAGPKRRDENLFDIDQKALDVDWASFVT